MDIPSYIVGPHQTVAINATVQHIPEIRDMVAAPPSIPGWLARTGPSGEMIREPDRGEIAEAFDEQLVVEFYSR